VPQGEVKGKLRAEEDQRLYLWTIFIEVLDVKKAYKFDLAARDKGASVSRMGMHHHPDGATRCRFGNPKGRRYVQSIEFPRF
jgi:hypothetical protein